MFCINKSSSAACLLCLCNCIKGECCFAGRLRSIYLYNPSSRVSSYAGCHIKRNRACRYNLNSFRNLSGAKPHYRALAKTLFYLRDRHLKRLNLILARILAYFLTHLLAHHASLSLNLTNFRVLCYYNSPIKSLNQYLCVLSRSESL